ncbi:hypothetical protein RDI58_029104 [Solanum bulbocastanum]|uniref:Hydroxyproline O-arabinosyltransferase-like domain-containing protein n=1 Tax=Solanum bulbocastanum TaxID=147425 RepID=A0AAN8ST27_SOLBU
MLIGSGGGFRGLGSGVGYGCFGGRGEYGGSSGGEYGGSVGGVGGDSGGGGQQMVRTHNTLRQELLSMGRMTTLVFLFLVFSFVTYNVITMIIRYTFVGFEKSNSKAVGHRDPIIHMPHNLTKRNKSEKLLFHIALTSTDTPYSKWQCRSPDNLMDEIPTFVVDPLPQGFDMGYIVLNRPWAFIQWLEKAIIEEEYILMEEPDHIFLNPLPNLAYGDYPVAFPFFYMKPA